MSKHNSTTAARLDAASDLPAAVAYWRMSTDKQDTSIEQQREKVRMHFAAKYRIVCEYADEGKSGSKDTDKRLAFLRMVDDLTDGPLSRGDVVRFALMALEREEKRIAEKGK